MLKLFIFFAGAVLGGLIGGVAGYVINDLTERENPEVIQEIEAEQAQQEEFEDFLDQLAATPPPSSNTPPLPVNEGSGDGSKTE